MKIHVHEESNSKAAYHCSGRGHSFRVLGEQFDETIAGFVNKICVRPERIQEFNTVILAEWEKRQQQRIDDHATIDLQIAAKRVEFKLTTDKLKLLTSELGIKYMEEDLIRIEADIRTIEARKLEKQEGKPINRRGIMSYVRYFLEHMEYQLLQQIYSVTKTNFFGLYLTNCRLIEK